MPNLRFILPSTELVVFMLPEMSMQNITVESTSLSPFSRALYNMYTMSSLTGISSFSMRRALG